MDGDGPALLTDPTPTLCTGRVDDLEAVLALWRRAGASPSSTESVGDLRGLLERDPEALLVAWVGDEIVGSVIAGWDGWRGTFYRLAVEPAQRRRGLATALVRAGEERLREIGAHRLNAMVESHKASAVAFWTSVGYELQAGRDRFVKNLP